MSKEKSRWKREREARRLTLQGRVEHGKETGRFFDRHAEVQIAYELIAEGDLLQKQFQSNSFEYVHGGFLRCFAALVGLLYGKIRLFAAALLIGYSLLLGLLLFLVFQALAV